jgi:transcriptional regulator with XRE-family HTH domain
MLTAGTGALKLDSLEFLGQGRGVDWKRLASYVARRRVEVGYSHRNAFANAIGISDNTLAKLERGESVRRDTLMTVENALGWRPGSANAILDGGEPDLLTRDAPPPTAGADVDTAFAHAVEVISSLKTASDAEKRNLFVMAYRLAYGSLPGEPQSAEQPTEHDQAG